LGLRYGNNIGLNYKGLQVGKFVVDRSGNATFNGVTIFNGNVQGITPANIGAVNKAGDTITGVLQTNSDIIQTRGYFKGEDADNTNHAIKLGHSGDNVLQFLEFGGQFDFYKSQFDTNTLLFQIKDGVSSKPLSVNNGGTGATTAAAARTNLEITPANIGAAPDTAVLAASSSIPIPAAGSSASYDMAGLTVEHQLVRWNFSASPENAPPVGLTWATYDGYFTIANNGRATSESIRPVFVLPKAVAVTTR
jgi:hypothetical protein